MKLLGIYEKVKFDNLAELKYAVAYNHADAYYFNGFTGDIHPIVLLDEELVIGADAFESVREEYLEDIYGYYLKN